MSGALGWYLGIDPGQAGGVAVIDGRGGVISAIPMPETPADLLSDLRRISHVAASDDGPMICALELVRSSPQMGVVSAFTFGRGYGQIEMALLAAGIPFDYVTPPVWQARLQCRSKGDKNVTKRRAQQLFGNSVTVTHKIADALLLAEFVRRQRLGIA